MDDKNDKVEQLDVTAEPAKVIPKLATKVGIAQSESGNVILSFVLSLPPEKPVLVERIVIDQKTSGELANLLSKAKDAKEEAEDE